MTTPTDWQALCAELLAMLDAQALRDPEMDGGLLRRRARAALAQPEPEGPTEHDIAELAEDIEWKQLPQDEATRPSFLLEFARAVLTRWGRPTIEPVPVAERLPEVGDWVWHCYAGVRLWEHGIYNGRQFFIGDGPESQPATHWLPRHALPIPTTH